MSLAAVLGQRFRGESRPNDPWPSREVLRIGPAITRAGIARGSRRAGTEVHEVRLVCKEIALAGGAWVQGLRIQGEHIQLAIAVDVGRRVGEGVTALRACREHIINQAALFASAKIDPPAAGPSLARLEEKAIP